jgi:serine/threonine-protein kinase RsbW
MSYWSRSFQGIAECLAEVRQFTAAVLGDRPGVDLVVLAASELAGNAILHSASGDPGGQFVVHIAAFADRWQVRVDDAGGAGVPRVCDTAGPGVDHGTVVDLPESGRGLALVAALSRNWGVLGDEYSRAVWAEIPHPRGEAASAVGVAAGGAAEVLDALAAAAVAAEIEPDEDCRRTAEDRQTDEALDSAIRRLLADSVLVGSDGR